MIDEQLLRVVERIERSLQETARIAAAAMSMNPSASGGGGGGVVPVDRIAAINAEGEAQRQEIDLTATKWEAFYTRQKDAIEKQAALQERLNSKIGNFVRTQSLDPTLGSGQRGALSGQGPATLSRLSGSLLSGLPTGGLIGLILFGEMEKQKFVAIGHTINNLFENVGGSVSSMQGRFTSVARYLTSTSRGSKEDVLALGAAFSQAGLQKTELDKNMTGEKGTGPGNWLSKTMGGISLTMSSAFGMDVTKSMATSIVDIGASAEKTGSQFIHFASSYDRLKVSGSLLVNTFSEVTSAMRFQRSSMEAAMPIYEALFDKETGMAPGATTAHRGAMASAGMGGMAKMLGGMSPGLSAFFGNRMTGKSGVDAIVGWQEGFAKTMSGTGGGTFLGNALGTISKWATKAFGPGEASQKWGMQQALGVDPVTARALYAVQGKMDTINESSMTGDEKGKAIKKQMETLNAFMRDRKMLNVGTFERIMTKSRDLIAKLGLGLYGMLKAVLNKLVLYVYTGVKYLMEEDGDAKKKISKQFDKEIWKQNTYSEESLKMFSTSLTGLGKEMSGLLKVLDGGDLVGAMRRIASKATETDREKQERLMAQVLEKAKVSDEHAAQIIEEMYHKKPVVRTREGETYGGGYSVTEGEPSLPGVRGVQRKVAKALIQIRGGSLEVTYNPDEPSAIPR